MDCEVRMVVGTRRSTQSHGLLKLPTNKISIYLEQTEVNFIAAAVCSAATDVHSFIKENLMILGQVQWSRSKMISKHFQ